MKLRLKRETLAELTPADLARIGGGKPPSPTPVYPKTLNVRECFILVTADQACLVTTKCFA